MSDAGGVRKPGQAAGSPTSADEGARAADRDSMFLKAEVRFSATGESGEVRVRNLSAGGMMAEAPVMARRGELVEVNLRNVGWVGGKIAWVAEGRFGIAFDCEVDAKAVRRPVAASPEVAIPNYLQKLNQPPPVPAKLRRTS